MAETSSDQERTEAPTQRRLERAFDEGTIQQPQDFYFLAALCLAAVIYLFGGAFFDILKHYVLVVFDSIADGRLARQTEIEIAGSALASVAVAIAVGAAAFLIAILSVGMAQQRFEIRLRPLRASFDNVSPVKGFQRLFGRAGLQRILTSLLKILALTAALGIVLSSLINVDFVRGDIISLHLAKLYIRSYAFPVVASALAIVAAVAFADLLFKRWASWRELLMSRQEIKEELRETEGNPEIAARLRQLRRKRRTLSTKHPMSSAEFLLTNPTHYAVAIAYFPQQGSAPLVIGKGAGIFAQRLRYLAWQARIPILREPQLTRQLFRATEVDQEIPEALFADIARILVYVYRLKGKVQ